MSEVKKQVTVREYHPFEEAFATKQFGSRRKALEYIKKRIKEETLVYLEKILPKLMRSKDWSGTSFSLPIERMTNDSCFRVGDICFALEDSK